MHDDRRTRGTPFLLAFLLAAGSAMADAVGSLPVGSPDVGEPAPDFALQRVDGTGTLAFSALWKERPLVLVFGSYT